MKKTNIILYSVLAIFTMAIILTSCKKENKNPENSPASTADFKISLKSTSSSRANYESINIEIQKIYIHTSSDTSETTGWFELETNGGIYDLIDYVSGNDAIIALDSNIDTITVSQIRIVLGENNTIIDNGTTYDLKTPSAQNSGIKIQIHAELQPNMSYNVVLDFDPEKSIINTGNGQYMLKPSIKAEVIEQ